MAARSMHAVVGLCGKRGSRPRGLGHADSPRLDRLAKKVSPASASSWPSPSSLSHPDIGAGKQRSVQVDRVTTATERAPCPRSHNDPHEVREPFLGSNGGHHLAVGVQLHSETP